MGSLVLNGASNSCTRLSLNDKSAIVESTLQQFLVHFQELLCELNQMQTEFDNLKTELLKQKEQCGRKTCSSSEELKKVIETKDMIIQLAASEVTRFNETQNHSIMSDILKILCGKVTPLTQSHDKIKQIKLENDPISQTNKEGVKIKLLSRKKELEISIDDKSLKDESVVEIEGTPGRTSPIIHSKKLKSSSCSSLSGNLAESREKKKCPDNWSTPESKQIKLFYTKSAGKSRQAKLCFMGNKPTSVVDLTCSPELSGGARPTQKAENPHVQLLIKKESSDNDDTILPSPTSSAGPTNSLLSKTSIKDGIRYKKPLTLLKPKMEQENEESSPILQVAPKLKDFMKNAELEDSINILKPKRFPKSVHKMSPKKQFNGDKLTIRIEGSTTTMESPMKKVNSSVKVEPDEVMTHFGDASMSLLQHVNKLEEKDVKKSPTKRPLVDNINLMNVQKIQRDSESSMSVLHPEPVPLPCKDVVENIKRNPIENVEPIYKEPTVRKKAEKMTLPAWCCDECKTFFGNLYADDAEKIKAVIDRCSKHRSRNNPQRPKTPPGFWNPRWDVPVDTEEFNRRNNVD